MINLEMKEEEEEEESRQEMKEEEARKNDGGSNGDDDDDYDDPNLISRQWKDGVLFEVGTDYEILKLIDQGWYWFKYSANKIYSSDEVVVTKFQDPFEYRFHKKFMGDYCRFIPVRILREIVVCRFLEFHPLFLELKDVIIPQGRETKYDRWSLEKFNDVYLVHESVKSNLDQLIKSEKKLHFELEFIFAQLIIGIHYLKKLQVIHRNLNPLNLLVNKDLFLKISDFGNSTIQKPEPMELTVKTSIYSCPELVLGCRSYEYSVDVWSAGCILGSILKGSDLFPDTSDKVARYVLDAKLNGNDISPAESSEKIQHLRDIILLIGVPSEDDLHFIDNEEDRILVNTIIDDIKATLGEEVASASQISSSFPYASESAIDLLERMLAFNPNKRINVEDVLQHEYVAEYVNFWKETNEGTIDDQDDKWDDMNEEEKLMELTSVKHMWADPTNEELCNCGEVFEDITNDMKLRHLMLTEMQRFHPSVHQ